MTSSAFSDILRVPASGFSPHIFSFSATSAGASDGGNAPAMASSNSFAVGRRGLARRPGVVARSCPARRWRATGSADRRERRRADNPSPVPCARRRFLRRPARRCAPSGCPARSGMPKPMMVRQAIITGPSAFCAAVSARKTSAASWPSQLSVVQPAALKRSIMSVGVRQRGRAVDGDVVVVPQHDQVRRASDARPARSLRG